MSASATPFRSQRFRKVERLTSRKTFDLLLKKGRSIQDAPFRLIWLIEHSESPFPAKIAFAVPKRNFKSAVERNKIKRLMREVYRKNKADLYTLLKQKEKQLAILIVYTGKTIPDYKEVEQKLTVILQRLAEVF